MEGITNTFGITMRRGEIMNKIKVGFAICGSFCTISNAMEQMRLLAKNGYEIVPIMSFNAYNLDTRFGKAHDIVNKIEEICEKKVIHDLLSAEPIGPKNMTDILIVAPCTGNTLSKLCHAINDTPATLAVKSHLRTGKPVLLALATNDALGFSAKNLGFMQTQKNIYFVPMLQDDPVNKPNSLVADFEMIELCLKKALIGEQVRPLIK